MGWKRFRQDLGTEQQIGKRRGKGGSWKGKVDQVPRGTRGRAHLSGGGREEERWGQGRTEEEGREGRV